MWKPSARFANGTKAERELEIRNRKALKVVKKMAPVFQAMQYTGGNELDFDEFLVGKTSASPRKTVSRLYGGEKNLLILGVYDDYVSQRYDEPICLDVGDWLVWDGSENNRERAFKVYSDGQFKKLFGIVETLPQWTKENEEWEESERNRCMQEAMQKISIMGV